MNHFMLTAEEQNDINSHQQFGSRAYFISKLFAHQQQLDQLLARAILKHVMVQQNLYAA